jgi:hypothetical protein
MGVKRRRGKMLRGALQVLVQDFIEESFFFLRGAAAHSRAVASSFTRFSRSHIRRATVGRIPLAE